MPSRFGIWLTSRIAETHLQWRDFAVQAEIKMSHLHLCMTTDRPTLRRDEIQRLAKALSTTPQDIRQRIDESWAIRRHRSTNSNSATAGSPPQHGLSSEPAGELNSSGGDAASPVNQRVFGKTRVETGPARAAKSAPVLNASAPQRAQAGLPSGAATAPAPVSSDHAARASAA